MQIGSIKLTALGNDPRKLRKGYGNNKPNN